MNEITDLKNQITDDLINRQSVSGIGVGEKWVDGKPTGENAILVFVPRKYSKNNVVSKFSVEEVIPSSIDGIPTDIIEVGQITKQHFKEKVRPIKPGFSCAHRKVGAGTLGGFFLDADNDYVILSNNHVLANENNAKIGDIIYQPGAMDTTANLTFNEWPDPVGNLPYFATLKKFKHLLNVGNDQDSAIAKINEKFITAGLIDLYYPTINNYLQGFTNPTIGTQVQKCGRTTGYTTGRILGLNASFTIGYDFGDARFDNCVVTTSMSSSGDSGSLIFDMSMNALALLFAGSTKVTIASPISSIVEYYGLKPWNKSQQPSIELDDGLWTIATAHGKLTVGKDSINIRSPANSYCYIQRSINEFNTINVGVNTGTDQGVIYGPGIAVIWPNGSLKISLRYNGSFAGSLNGNELLGIGKVSPNTDYRIRIRKDNNSYVGEVLDGNNWYKVIEVPTSVFPHNPKYLVVGKLGKTGLIGNEKNIGGTFECSFKDLDVK